MKKNSRARFFMRFIFKLLLVATVLFSVFVVVKLVVGWVSNLSDPFSVSFGLVNIVVFSLPLDLFKSDSKFVVGFGYDDLSKFGGNFYGF